MKKEIIISLLALTIMGSADEFYYDNGKKVELKEVEVTQSLQHRVNNNRTKYYKTSRGATIGVRDDILVECEEGVECKEVLSKYETTSVSNLSKSIFIVKIAKDKNIFEFAQKLYSDKHIKIAHPNIRKNKRRR
ncbi:hypothetical protein MNB_SV-12-254 [hydrothermal vent metagenome]|uniref:Uncharacterized protein n=1 Tax=hydrothermal vent metagenome TaxID=652676 RepID=A0A1W1BFU6_9ZZZZ